MEATLTQRKTYADYALLPEGSAYQLINGELVMSPAPNIMHHHLVIELAFLIKQFVSERKLGKVFVAPTDVYLSETDCFQPDILFIAKERQHIIGVNRIGSVLDIVIEILSPSTGYLDLTHKKTVYETAGVKEFWIWRIEKTTSLKFSKIRRMDL